MKHKVIDLEGALLDAAVATADGLVFDYLRMTPHGADFITVAGDDEGWTDWSPSRRWADGGPILDRAGIVAVPFVPHADVAYDAANNHDWPAMLPKVRWGAWCGVVALAWLECNPEQGWVEDPDVSTSHATGPTRLVAAMRAYVVSKVGPEVELPPIPGLENVRRSCDVTGPSLTA